MTFETTGKFVLVFVRLILGKLGVDVFTGPRREIDVRSKRISISSEGYKDENRDSSNHFSKRFETTFKFVVVFVRLILGKVGVDVFAEPRRKSGVK